MVSVSQFIGFVFVLMFAYIYTASAKNFGKDRTGKYDNLDLAVTAILGILSLLIALGV